jgi:MFS family permease
MALVFSKYFYLASLTSYYTFFLMSRFHVPVRSAQIHLFLFLGAVAAGTFIGGPVGDRIGRKYVIWCSILGILPFTLALPYANLFWTTVLSVVIGLVLASAFSAIIVYAHDLVPGQDRHDLRAVLRPGVRHGGRRGGDYGLAGGCHEYRLRLPGVLVPAGHRPADRVSAEFGNRLQAECPLKWNRSAFSSRAARSTRITTS